MGDNTAPGCSHIYEKFTAVQSCQADFIQSATPANRKAVFVIPCKQETKDKLGDMVNGGLLTVPRPLQSALMLT